MTFRVRLPDGSLLRVPSDVEGKGARAIDRYVKRAMKKIQAGQEAAADAADDDHAENEGG